MAAVCHYCKMSLEGIHPLDTRGTGDRLSFCGDDCYSKWSDIKLDYDNVEDAEDYDYEDEWDDEDDEFEDDYEDDYDDDDYADDEEEEEDYEEEEADEYEEEWDEEDDEFEDDDYV